MRRSVSLVTGPAADPVTLGEIKTYAKIDGNDEDALLAAYITASTEFTEKYLKRSLITQTRKLTLDLEMTGSYKNLQAGVYEIPLSVFYSGPGKVIELPYGPVQSVSSIVTYDTSNNSSTFASSNYTVDTAGGRVFLNDTAVWPSPLRQFAAIEITYVAGYGDTSSSIPQPIKTGIQMHVQRMYDARIICDLPDECRTLMNAYRIVDGLAS